MIIDNDLKFSTADTNVRSNAASENVIDMGAAGDAVGEELSVVVKTNTVDFDSAGDAGVLQIAVQTAIDEAFSSPVIKLISPLIPQDTLLANKIVWVARLPKGLLRYVRLYYTVTGANFSAGTVDAFLTPNPEVRS